MAARASLTVALARAKGGIPNHTWKGSLGDEWV